MAAPVNATFILDATVKKVKVFTAGSWKDLSEGAGNENSVEMTLQSAFTENTDAKVVIGDPETAPNGILVLESATKALVMPKVEDPHLNIAAPAPGMMVYDPVKNLLCVYNGTQWSYWKPSN